MYSRDRLQGNLRHLMAALEEATSKLSLLHTRRWPVRIRRPCTHDLVTGAHVLNIVTVPIPLEMR